MIIGYRITSYMTKTVSFSLFSTWSKRRLYCLDVPTFMPTRTGYNQWTQVIYLDRSNHHADLCGVPSQIH